MTTKITAKPEGSELAPAPINPAVPGQLMVDLSSQTLPNLNEAVAAPIDLMANYWTPEKPGESKRVIFDRIDTRKVLPADGSSTEPIDLDCAFMYEEQEGQIVCVSNGSKRLVGALETMPRGAALLITYMGKKKNRNNSFSSDNWSIRPLVILQK